MFSAHIILKATRNGLTHADTWHSLPDMRQPRTLFTPAVWKGAIYLCGGWENDTIEVWDGEKIALFDLK